MILCIFFGLCYRGCYCTKATAQQRKKHDEAATHRTDPVGNRCQSNLSGIQTLQKWPAVNGEVNQTLQTFSQTRCWSSRGFTIQHHSTIRKFWELIQSQGKIDSIWLWFIIGLTTWIWKFNQYGGYETLGADWHSGCHHLLAGCQWAKDIIDSPFIMCVCVSVCVCLCVCVHACTHACMHACMHARMYVCMYVMSCHVMSCYVMLCCVMLCNVM